MAFNKMDPSCTIGFYSKNVEHYERINSELSKVSHSDSLKALVYSCTVKTMLFCLVLMINVVISYMCTEIGLKTCSFKQEKRFFAFVPAGGSI